MPLLQVRDFPQDIYERLKYEAKQQHRSIAQHTIILIKKGLDEDVSNQERRKRVFEKIQNRYIPESAKEIDVVKWIREDRNR
jgi:hypothetical protein